MKRDELPPLPYIEPGKHRHFKGGEYELLFVARDSETEKPVVVYKALYGKGECWVRPAEMWDEEVTRDGVTVKRFTRVNDE